MSTMQTYTGPEEAWNDVFDVVNSYILLPHVPQSEKETLISHMKALHLHDNPVIPRPGVGLTFAQIQEHVTYRFRQGERHVAGCRAKCIKKGRTKVVVELLDDATNNWKAGTKVRTNPSSLERMVP